MPACTGWLVRLGDRLMLDIGAAFAVQGAGFTSAAGEIFFRARPAVARPAADKRMGESTTR